MITDGCIVQDLFSLCLVIGLGMVVREHAAVLGDIRKFLQAVWPPPSPLM